MLGRFPVAMVVNDFICKTTLLLLFKASCRNCGTLLYIFPRTFQCTSCRSALLRSPSTALPQGASQFLLCPRVPDFIFTWGRSDVPAALSDLLESHLLPAAAEGRSPFRCLRWGAGAHPGWTQPCSPRTGQGGLWKHEKDGENPSAVVHAAQSPVAPVLRLEPLRPNSMQSPVGAFPTIERCSPGLLSGKRSKSSWQGWIFLLPSCPSQLHVPALSPAVPTGVLTTAFSPVSLHKGFSGDPCPSLRAEPVRERPEAQDVGGAARHCC